MGWPLWCSLGRDPLPADGAGIQTRGGANANNTQIKLAIVLASPEIIVITTWDSQGVGERALGRAEEDW